MTVAAVAYSEGFDKYGPPAPISSVYSASFLSNLFAGEWQSVIFGSGAVSLVAPLIGIGAALQIAQGSSTNGTLKRDMGVSYSRAVGGVWLRIDALPDRSYLILTFTDSAGNTQGGIGVNSSGQLFLAIQSAAAQGTAAGSIVATSVALTTGSVHHVTWDFVCSDTGAYSFYVDNNLVESGTADFKASTISSWRSIQLGQPTPSVSGSLHMTYDSLWVGDDTGTPIMTMPVVETDFPTSDNSVHFAVGVGALGWWAPTVNVSNAPGANELYLRKVTCPAGGATITAVSAYMAATSAGAKFKAVVYADNAGTPNAQSLLASASADTVGATSLTVLTSTLATPYAMTGGTSYWIGFITDTSVAIWEADGSTTGVKAANTYTSGAPGTCPTVTTAQPDWCLWGTLTGVTHNFYEVGQNPTPCFMGGDFSYNTSSTSGDEDLFNFNILSITPSVIHASSVKAYLRDSDAGTRTITLNMKSVSTDSTGSLAAVQPITSAQWYGSYFQTDPNTSAAWAASDLNIAPGGYKIAS